MNFTASQQRRPLARADELPAFDDFHNRPLFSRHSSQPAMSVRQPGDFYQQSSQQAFPPLQQSLGFSQRLEQTAGYQRRPPFDSSMHCGGFSQRTNRDGYHGYQGRVAVAWAGDSFSQRPALDGCQGRQTVGNASQGFSQSSARMPLSASASQAFSQSSLPRNTQGRQGQQKSRGGARASNPRPTQSQDQQQQQASAGQAWTLKRQLSQQEATAIGGSGSGSKRARLDQSQATVSGTPASAGMSAGFSQQQQFGNNKNKNNGNTNGWSRYSSQPPIQPASLLQLGEATVQDLWDFMVGRFQAMEAQQAHSLAAITAKLDQLLNQMVAVQLNSAASTQQSTVFELCGDDETNLQPAVERRSAQPPPQQQQQQQVAAPQTPQRKSNVRVRRKTPTIRDALSELLNDQIEESQQQPDVVTSVTGPDIGESPSLFDYSFRP